MTDQVVDLNLNTDQAAPESDPTQELLKTITKEDGSQKYSDVAEAVSSIPRAQEHIAVLETENAELREQAAKIASMEAMIAKLSSAAPVQPQAPVDAPTTPAPTGVTVEQVQEILAQNAKQQSYAEKKKEFSSAMANTYGDKAQEELNRAMADKGLSGATLERLISDNPNVALQLLGVKTTAPTSVTTPVSTVDSRTVTPTDKPRADQFENKAMFFDALWQYEAGGN